MNSHPEMRLIMRIFLSHSSTDSKLATEVCAMLEANGHSCFIAPRDIRSGHEYAQELVDGIDGADVMLLLLSKRANDSPHVLREVERAVSKNKPIIVYKLENFTLNKSMEYFLMTHQWLDSQTDVDHSAILKCIDEFADGTKSTRNDISTDSENASSGKTDTKHTASKSSPRKTIIAVAAVLLAAVIAVSAFVVPHLKKTAGSPSNAATLPDYNTEKPVFSENTEIKLGDTVSLGRYNDEPILWRVIHISEDEASAVVISDKLLTMKAFDVAEGGEYNAYDGENYWRTATDALSKDMQRLVRGDNRWSVSNLRTWLNSDREMVKYTDCPPAAKAMSMHNNGYDTEAGFLHNFTENELSAILTTQVQNDGDVTEDKIFLLSSDELSWLYDADVSIYAKPTSSAIELDESGWYSSNLEAYKCKDHFWWLRDTDGNDACRVKVVNISYGDEQIIADFAGLEGYGVRPAMTIDLTSDIFKN